MHRSLSIDPTKKSRRYSNASALALCSMGTTKTQISNSQPTKNKQNPSKSKTNLPQIKTLKYLSIKEFITSASILTAKPKPSMPNQFNKNNNKTMRTKKTFMTDKLPRFALYKRPSTTAPSSKLETKTLSVLHPESETTKKISISLTMSMLLSNTKQDPDTRGTNLMDKEMETENSFTKMVAITKANGKTTKWMGGVGFFMKEGNWPMKATGAKTNSMGSARFIMITPCNWIVDLTLLISIYLRTIGSTMKACW